MKNTNLKKFQTGIITGVIIILIILVVIIVVDSINPEKLPETVQTARTFLIISGILSVLVLFRWCVSHFLKKGKTISFPQLSPNSRVICFCL